MGAEYFTTIAKGRSAAEAFVEATERAAYDYGHSGYSGSIAEKHGFVELTETEAERLAESVAATLTAERAATTPRTAKTASWRLYGTTPGRAAILRRKALTARIKALQGGKRSRGLALAEEASTLPLTQDKWGPAHAIKLAKDTWIFFGWASS